MTADGSLVRYDVGIAVNGTPTYVVEVPSHLGREAAERRARMTICAHLRTVDLDAITVCDAGTVPEDDR